MKTKPCIGFNLNIYQPEKKLPNDLKKTYFIEKDLSAFLKLWNKLIR